MVPDLREAAARKEGKATRGGEEAGGGGGTEASGGDWGASRR